MDMGIGGVRTRTARRRQIAEQFSLEYLATLDQGKEMTTSKSISVGSRDVCNHF